MDFQLIYALLASPVLIGAVVYLVKNVRRWRNDE